jgi:hypothetical protein
MSKKIISMVPNQKTKNYSTIVEVKNKINKKVIFYELN